MWAGMCMWLPERRRRRYRKKGYSVARIFWMSCVPVCKYERVVVV
jgi:hypothetical protein